MSELRQRQPRQLNPGYLTWLRLQPCACGCGSPPRSDAAHIRSAGLKYGKPHTGMAEKPNDSWALPLKHAHHMAQTDHGDELGWWAAHGVKDVFALALRYNARYFQQTGKLATEHHEPKKRSTKTARRSRSKAKIAQRRNQWPKGRKIKNRGFGK